ncbi:Protein of unknown function [Streptomyces zhaozhouensis]|uniref:DUF1648 domain-containing protein n=1 Tax=Streptomyces zhaozhouensis TaxID=1300267 RepID=A0A286E092_9ACTN|nr:DUF1648 domain-containing protein [Streptomyces zhaozhouensis]SOD64318.1 Protein of unknown function [Streptomyces zhaozhouensis]
MGTEKHTGERQATGLWWWAAPSLLLLTGLTVWGVARYPDLPDRIPRHIGPGGVDAWGERGVALAFVPVFVYAGLTVLMIGCAWSALRTTPLDRMPPPESPWAAAAAVSGNRPANAASARRLARALLLCNALLGLAFLPMAWVQWRAEEQEAVAWWLLAGPLLCLVLSLVPPLLAAWRDAGERRALREHRRAA